MEMYESWWDIVPDEIRCQILAKLDWCWRCNRAKRLPISVYDIYYSCDTCRFSHVLLPGLINLEKS